MVAVLLLYIINLDVSQCTFVCMQCIMSHDNGSQQVGVYEGNVNQFCASQPRRPAALGSLWLE